VSSRWRPFPTSFSRKFPGSIFTIDGDDYSTLIWYPENSIPKPPEATIRSYSDEVDALVKADNDAQAQQQAMFDRPDTILTMFEILASENPTRIAALRDKIANIRATVTS
jgi:hypothetical protein